MATFPPVLVDQKRLTDFDVVVRVLSVDFTDYIFSAYDQSISVEFDNIKFTGQFGYIRIQNGKASVLQTVNAEQLTYKGDAVTQNNSVSGIIADVFAESNGDECNAFVVDKQLDESLKGKYVIVKHPDNTTNGYKIKSIVREGGKYIIDIGDSEPGFLIHGNISEMTYYPHKKWEGIVEFIIEDCIVKKAN